MSAQPNPTPTHDQAARPKLQLVASNSRAANTPLRGRILEAACEGRTTRQIAQRLAIPEDRVTAVIADEVEFAARLTATLDVIVLPEITRMVRRAVAAAREDARERRVA
jgi:hypothetical protein